MHALECCATPAKFLGAFHAYEARVKIFNRYGANPSHTLIWVNANGITLESSR